MAAVSRGPAGPFPAGRPTPSSVLTEITGAHGTTASSEAEPLSAQASTAYQYTDPQSWGAELGYPQAPSTLLSNSTRAQVGGATLET